MSDNDGQVVSTVLQKYGTRIKARMANVDIEVFQGSSTSALDEFEEALKAVAMEKKSRAALREN